VKFDDRKTHKPGWKFAEYELKGVPVRLAMGMRDIENNTIEVARRDTLEKQTYNIENIEDIVYNLLEEIQSNLFLKANNFRKENTYTAESYDEFKQLIEKGGFVYAHWDGTSESEEKIKNETKATIRCIPLVSDKEEGLCIISQKKSAQKVLFAKAY